MNFLSSLSNAPQLVPAIMAWAVIASLALVGLIWRLWSLRRRLIQLIGANVKASSTRSLREAFNHLQAIMAAQHKLLAQNSRTRDQLRDFTRHAEKLRRQQWAAQQLFAHLDEGVFMASHDGKVLEVNPALEDMLQRPAYLMRERLLHEVLAPDDEQLLKNLCANIHRQVEWEGRVLLRRSDRSLFPALLRLHSLLDDAGRPQYLLGVLQDLSPVEETHAKLHQLTHHNPITGLQNRVSFLDELDALLNIDRQQHWVLMIIGIDRFTIVHDTLGLNLSHRFLQEVAKRLKQNLHSHERLAQTGDDEFALLFATDASSTAQDAPLQRAHELLRLMQRPYELTTPRYRLSLTASIGMAQAPKDGHNADTLEQAAHLALQHASKHGGNHVMVYDRLMADEVGRRFRIEQGLRHALERQEIECYMQPLVSAQDAELKGFECLMRWTLQHGESVSPLDFIPVAEETGLIIPLTTWLLDQACKHLALWRKLTAKPLFVSLNLSPRQLLDPELPEMLVATLRRHHLDPTALMLEITESGLMSSFSLIRERILQLAMHGFLIAIDDFGTGYSSLSLLSELPIDKLKIDQSFIRDKIPHHSEAVRVVEAMLALARGLELAVVVEGIENAEQVRFIRQRLPSALLQGYLFSKPASAHAWDGELLGGKLPVYAW